MYKSSRWFPHETTPIDPPFPPLRPCCYFEFIQTINPLELFFFDRASRAWFQPIWPIVFLFVFPSACVCCFFCFIIWKNNFSQSLFFFLSPLPLQTWGGTELKVSLTIQAKEEEEKKNRESRSPVTFSGAGPVECLYFSLLHLPIFIFLSLYFWMVVFSSFFLFFWDAIAESFSFRFCS